MTSPRVSRTNILLVAAAVVCFVIGGGLCAWVMNDNNLLQGASSQEEIELRLTQRRTDLLQAFLLGGTVCALVGCLLVVAGQKITSRRDDS